MEAYFLLLKRETRKLKVFGEVFSREESDHRRHTKGSQANEIEYLEKGNVRSVRRLNNRLAAGKHAGVKPTKGYSLLMAELIHRSKSSASGNRRLAIKRGNRKQ